MLLVLGCMSSPEVTEQPPDPVRDTARVSLDPALAIADDDDICSLLPSCGPCSLACDPEKLAEEYVPKGACALFLCTLTDGRTIEVDACNLDECVARMTAPSGRHVPDSGCGANIALRAL